ncbi:peptidase M14 [Chloracidobacterium validum]|uniref:Peptidase M14 n=1 Tax=Chloracidobacterium validum TaxID=2821543 RepID=A0ABX8BH34_9BACT|nr:M14 family metallopeptidase [Chloracidobacterium validum]QUW04395.1 peptidase M14 [Chloracidobacterium validum]
MPSKPAPIKLEPMPPRSGYEAPAAALARSLAESTAAAPKAFLTRCEKTDYAETGTYAETVALWKKMATASPYAELVAIGETAEGRTLYVLVASKDKAFTPTRAHKTGKPVVFIQNGIHPGEISGKDATSMLLRDILITKRHAAILDSVILVTMPVFNADGHERFSPWHRINQNGPREMGFRATATRLNLNRDYVKADAPEMRAWLRFFTAWKPDFFMDNHVTDGMDHQYDVTLDMPTEQNIWPTVGAWSKETFLPKLYERLEADGHVVGPYAEPRDARDWSKGFDVGVIEPRYSTTYVALWHRPALLVETHSLKSHRTQTWAHYDLMVHALAIIGAEGARLRNLVTEAERDMARLATREGPRKAFFLAGTPGDTGTPFTYKGVAWREETSLVTGQPVRVYESRPIDIPTTLFTKLKTTAAVPLPAGYLIPAAWTSVIEVLAAHGVELRRLRKAVTVTGETYRLSEPIWAARPFEGRLRLTNFTTRRIQVTRTLPAGTVYVPMDQPAARVIFNWLEPEGPDSAVRWGLFNTMFEQKEYAADYVFEPIARELLARNPKLRAEFERRLAEDADFAASPHARFQFLYERSPYYETDKDVYPVVRALEPLR